MFFSLQDAAFDVLCSNFTLQILHSMAMAVLQLHECRLVHSKLSLKFFKVA